jgi:integrase
LATFLRSPRKDGYDSWRAHIRISRGGKVVYQEGRTFHRRSNAEAWAEARERDLESAEAPEETNCSGITLGQLLDAYLSDPGTRMSRAKHERLKFLLGTSLAQITLEKLGQSQVIEHVRDRVDGGCPPATVNNDLIWLRTVARWAQPYYEYQISLEEIESALTYCRLTGYIARTKARDRRPTADELWRLTEYFNNREDKAQLPMQEIIWFAVHSSRRLTEITGLLWSDIDYDERTGRVRESGNDDKETADRSRFRYTSEAWEIVQRQPRTELRIFPYDSDDIGTAFTDGCHATGIHDLRFHDLRHEAMSRLFETGHTIRDIQKVSLVRDWNTLRRYTHLNATDTPAKKGMIIP